MADPAGKRIPYASRLSSAIDPARGARCVILCRIRENPQLFLYRHCLFYLHHYHHTYVLFFDYSTYVLLLQAVLEYMFCFCVFTFDMGKIYSLLNQFPLRIKKGTLSSQGPHLLSLSFFTHLKQRYHLIRLANKFYIHQRIGHDIGFRIYDDMYSRANPPRYHYL